MNREFINFAFTFFLLKHDLFFVYSFNSFVIKKLVYLEIDCVKKMTTITVEKLTKKMNI